MVLDDDEFRLLRYVGFYTHIYTCMLLPPDADVEHPHAFSIKYTDRDGEPCITNYKVKELSISEAIKFSDVNDMKFVQPFHVRD